MKTIGITGPTGAGKTTALGALERLGTLVLDADEVYHGLLEHSKPMTKALVERFGGKILDETGKIDRKRLADTVYGGGMADLNAITHRFVLEEIHRQIEAARGKYTAVAIDAIALVESGAAAECDVVVAVLAPAELRVRRIMTREGIDEGYARRRVEAQQPDSFFRAHSDYVLENTEEDTAESFAARARALFEQVLRT